jgi:hypothetical protein
MPPYYDQWTFGGRAFHIIDYREERDVWWVFMDGKLFMTRPSHLKPNRLHIHAVAFGL